MAGSAGSELSRGGMVTKIEAGKIAMRAGTDMIITSGKEIHPIAALLGGSRATFFKSKVAHETARKTWIAGQLDTLGSITIDDGAVHALTRGKSLLPAGVIKSEGGFSRGDIITIKNIAGETIGQGLIAYGAKEANLILGHKSKDMTALLGYEGRPTMVHRDDMALMPPLAPSRSKSDK